MEFNVGDRVRAARDLTGMLIEGMLGTVISSGDDERWVGVRWDDNIYSHSCDGLCEEGHGWWSFTNDLIKVENDVTNDCTVDLSADAVSDLENYLNLFTGVNL